MAGDLVPPDSDVIRGLMKQRAWTQEDLLANDLSGDVTQGFLKKALSGKPVRKLYLQLVARVFDVPVDALIFREETSRPRLPKPDVISVSDPSGLRLYPQVDSIRVAGADAEWFPPDLVHIAIDNTPYEVPAEIRDERPTLVAEFRRQARAQKRKFWNGTSMRLVDLWVSARDSSERKHLELTLGPIRWHDYTVVHQVLAQRAKAAGTLGSFVDLRRVGNEDLSHVRFTNITDTAATLLTTDGYLVYTRRGEGVSVTAGMLSCISENIHPTFDNAGQIADSANLPLPFRTIKRGIGEEVSRKLARQIHSDAIMLLGLAFALDYFQPDLLFLVAVPCSLDEVLAVARDAPGRDFYEGHLLAVRPNAEDEHLKSVLATPEWDMSGKACLVRSIEFLEAVQDKYGMTTVEVAERLARGNVSWIE